MRENGQIKVSLMMITITLIVFIVGIIVGVFITQQVNKSKTNENTTDTQNYNEIHPENTTKSDEPKEETDIPYEEYSIEYSLNNDDIGFLTTTKEEKTKYEMFDNYSDYKDCYDSIDKWGQDVVERYTKNTNDRIDEVAAENPESYSNPEELKEDIVDEYKEIVENRISQIKEAFEEKDYSEEFFEDNVLILVEHSVYVQVLHEMELSSIEKDNKKLNIQFDTEVSGVVAGGQCRLYFITIPKKYMQDIKKINVAIDETNTSVQGVAYKPIIYLYPTEKTNILVRILKDNNITCSYPKYDAEGWNITAEENGNLTDNKTGRNLYSLYYECENDVNFKIEKEGFVVKGEAIAEFLEEKLAILGLTERESEEFIVYWLPKLEANKYNYIRFATEDEINENMPLEINPKPDTTIRVLMTFKALDVPADVEEQKLTTPERTGFVAVEWGGTEIE